MLSPDTKRRDAKYAVPMQNVGTQSPIHGVGMQKPNTRPDTRHRDAKAKCASRQKSSGCIERHFYTVSYDSAKTWVYCRLEKASFLCFQGLATCSNRGVAIRNRLKNTDSPQSHGGHRDCIGRDECADEASLSAGARAALFFAIRLSRRRLFSVAWSMF